MTHQGLSPAELGEERPRDHGGMVIVLDTDPGVRWALEKGLKRSGYDVRTASTSGEALRLLYAEPVRAVIMEILPEADLTPEVLTTVLESPSHPKVICVSMESEPKAIIECVRRGAADFVPVPGVVGYHPLLTLLEAVTYSGEEARIPRRSYIFATGYQPTPFPRFSQQAQAEGWDHHETATSHFVMEEDPELTLEVLLGLA